MSRLVKPQPLTELIAGLPIRDSGMLAVSDPFITDLTEDSRTVQPGSLFIARRGEQFDGTRFIPQAIAARAAAVLTEREATLSSETIASIEQNNVALLITENIATTTAVIAERFFGNPSTKLRLVGITGTNGKTTTAHLIHQVLNAAGVRCGMLGTVSVDDGSGLHAANLTTPFAIDISRTLARMVANGCGAAVMEVSSHALAQGRSAGLNFAGAIFTNLTGDHLDYHHTMDAYADAKAILFETLGEDDWAIMNADDPAALRMKRNCPARIVETTMSDSAQVDQWQIQIGTLTPDGMNVRLRPPGNPDQHIEASAHLVGRHNAMNLLQAVVAAVECGLPISDIVKHIPECKAPPGRLESVVDPSNELTVLVDYAHTDDALRNVLSAVGPIVPDGARLIAVFGCGGDRDRSKRPRMAQVACELADIVVITSDNPRTEDPQRIIDDILDGVPTSHDRRAAPVVTAEVDRAKAIHHTINELARPRDIIVIAGKGHEDYQIVGTVRRPFDDRQIAGEALEHRFARTRIRTSA